MAACLSTTLGRRGFEVLVTCREYECTEATIRSYGLDPIVVGRYGGGTRYGKLMADVERMRVLAGLVARYKPDVLVSYPNPSAARVAYGLGVKYIVLNDSPHSEAANTLSLPLCEALVVSEGVPVSSLTPYLLPRSKIFQYRGVEELLWVESFEPSREVLEELNLEKYEYVVVRPEEFKAAYYSWRGWSWIELCDEIVSSGLKVVVLPRYEEQRRRAVEKGYIVPEGCVDGLSLAYYARALVTGGGTMAKEAALMGTPAYYTFPIKLYVNEYLAKLGFPLVHWSSSWRELVKDILEIDESVIRESKRAARKLAEKMESPERALFKALREVIKH